MLKRGLKCKSCLQVVTFSWPGYTADSFGYRSYDGEKRSNGGDWESYGPNCKVNDVIGCGLLGGDLFYTKNGEFLGVAYRNVPHGLYPSVYLGYPSSTVVTNFGQSPFRFRLDWDEVRRLCE